MTRGEAFADELAARAATVFAPGDPAGSHLRVGPAAFTLIAAAPGGETLAGAFLGGVDPPPEPASQHRILVWDGTTPDRLPPARPWGPTAHEPLGLINDFCDENVRCAFDLHTSSLLVADRRRNRSFVWFPDLEALPAWARASPFRIVLSWLLVRHGVQVVHGAAVSSGGRAALLCGNGGSGKSTAALACALAGMGYLGDDYCAIEPAGSRVHLVYRTAKVLAPSVAMLPALRDRLVNADRLAHEKGVLFLDRADVDLVPTAEVKVILLPRVSGDRATRSIRATRADAVRGLLPSTIGGLMGGTAETPGLLLSLVNRVPAFRLELGTDVPGIVAAVRGLIEAAP